ncbi:peptide/nickel transport system substrate-binding protein [Faunimonas pinastri]|uniref:Peptide/nickel transport system substrate-binding protein n=1 Tax=Faunimonas pinastri TaxID=1855383 RepID=A0A1H9L8T9_9HYPH|nr:extracellular solute-binding protein [Faunimonas pinastri]SER07846.1 peptide/nickel transport system substrate-binding protein [Faunimonas pinastri]
MIVFRTARTSTACKSLLRITLWLGLCLVAGRAAWAEPTYGIAMHGEPALPADFTHFPYANPDAPKGGSITYAGVGSFDSLNPFILQGTAPRGLWDMTWGNNIWESLLVRSKAEPFTMYGLIASTVDVAPDLSTVDFQLRPEAKFSDGVPITPDDVIFSFDLLREKGRERPYRETYKLFDRAEKLGDHGVRFVLKPGTNRELPLLIGLMPILPKHAVDAATFDRSSLKIPIGSGPYTIAAVDPGKSVTLKRDPNYWARNLPAKRGFDNFDQVRVEYYRDASAYFEAFKKGLFDINPENDPARWAIAYDFPAVHEGRVVLDTFPIQIPAGMNGFFFNTRRPVFEDARVRQALTYFLDFEWLNRNIYYGKYERTGSYFEGSELSAIGRPATDAERRLLAPFPDAVVPDVMNGTYRPPESDGSGHDRDNMRKGVELLEQAGYGLKNGLMVNLKTGEPLAFEIMTNTREQDRLALAFSRTLALAGIRVRIHDVDSAQYERRVKNFDYDMIQILVPASLSPGTEQAGRWSSAAADAPGSFSYSGVKSPAVDAMINAMLAAHGQGDFVSAVRSLDRVLISGFYVVPLFHPPGQWMGRWARVEHPEQASLWGPEPTTWWQGK